MCSNELVEIMKEFLDSLKAEYTFKENVFRFDAWINDKMQNVCFIIRVEENEYFVSAVPEDVTVTESKTTEVLEYINMVNIETVGSSMTVYEDFVMCSSALKYRGSVPGVEQIRKCFASIISCLESFGGGLLDVIAGIGAPKEIFEKCMEADGDV